MYCAGFLSAVLAVKIVLQDADGSLLINDLFSFFPGDIGHDQELLGILGGGAFILQDNRDAGFLLDDLRDLTGQLCPRALIIIFQQRIAHDDDIRFFGIGILQDAQNGIVVVIPPEADGFHRLGQQAGIGFCNAAGDTAKIKTDIFHECHYTQFCWCVPLSAEYN